MAGNEVANSRGIPKHHRSGGQLGSYRYYKRGIVANESAPTDKQQAVVVGDRFSQVRWVAVDTSGAGVTAFNLHYGRLVSVRHPNGQSDLFVPRFIEDPDSPAVAVSDFVEVSANIDGDPVWAYVNGIVGGPPTNAAGDKNEDGIIIIRKGVNRQSSK